MRIHDLSLQALQLQKRNHTCDPPKSMAAAPEEATEATSLPASEASELLSSFTSFLTLSIHSLLYYRSLYPQTTFLTARAYNLPVHQSRHPKVCKWVLDAVAAVKVQLTRATVEKIVFVIHAPDSFSVLERWVFDVGSFPAWQDPSAEPAVDEDDGLGDDDGLEADEEEEEEEEEEQSIYGYDVIEEEGDEGDEEGEIELPDDDVEEEELINWTDVNEALRGALRNLSYVAERLPALPKGCTFTLAVDIRKGTPAPATHPRPWLAAPPNRQRLNPVLQDKQKQSQQQKQKRRVKGKIPARRTETMAPVRAVQAGPMFFECWAELSKPRPPFFKKPEKPAEKKPEVEKPEAKPNPAGPASEPKELHSILKKTPGSGKRVQFKDVPVQESEKKPTRISKPRTKSTSKSKSKSQSRSKSKPKPTPAPALKPSSTSTTPAALSHRVKTAPPQGK
uniref:HORMA domain-containing protein n=1 Tax=Bionectria ochroleuca TaxID=29856 RepID=A0A8H7N2R4_BIOOC